MTAVLGALFLAVTVVLYRWAYIHHRRPARSRWARNGTASMLVQFAILSALAAGLSFAVQFLVAFDAKALTVMEIATVPVIVGAAALTLRVLNRQWRGLQAEAPHRQTGTHELDEPANDPGPGLPPRSGDNSAKVRRAS